MIGVLELRNKTDQSGVPPPMTSTIGSPTSHKEVDANKLFDNLDIEIGGYVANLVGLYIEANSRVEEVTSLHEETLRSLDEVKRERESYVNDRALLLHSLERNSEIMDASLCVIQEHEIISVLEAATVQLGEVFEVDHGK